MKLRVLHHTHKKIPHVYLSECVSIKQTEPNGMELELFAIDVFSHGALRHARGRAGGGALPVEECAWHRRG